jgi:hypothetical protein
MADDSGGGGASTLVVAIVALLSAALGSAATLAATLGAGYFTFASKDQELKVHLVEIAISILRADPKEDVVPARGWALDIVEKNSGVPFSQQDREALLHKPLANSAFWDEMAREQAETMRKLQKLNDELKASSPSLPPSSPPHTP